MTAAVWSRLGFDPTQGVSKTVSRANRLGSIGGCTVVGILALYPVIVRDRSLIFVMIPIAMYAMVAVGLNFAIGYAGEFALGQAGVFAVSAYMCGVLTTHYNLSFWLALPCSVVGASIVGVVISMPGLRVGGWYFALTSLFTAVVIPVVASQLPHTGGTEGFGNIPFPSIAATELTFTQIYLLTLVGLLLMLLGMANIIRSRWGLAFVSLRESNKGAEATGIGVYRMKILVYAIAAVCAAFSGAIFPVFEGYLSPAAFPLSLSILLIAGVAIGGMGSLVGPVVGIGLLQIIPQSVSGFDKYSLLIYGGILIVVMLFMRRGLVPTARLVWVRLVLAMARRHDVIARADEAERTVPRVAAGKGGEEGDGPAPLVPIRHAIARASISGTGGDLVVEGVWKRFGGVHALEDVSLVGRAGAITAVIGPNGSGKTTLLNVILGYYRADRGSIRLGSKELTGLQPHRVARSGIARTFQTPIVMPELTCRDNVISGMFVGRQVSFFEVLVRAPRSRIDWHAAGETADSLLDAVGLGAYVGEEAGTLTAGQQRLLGIGRALAGSPSTILLDEPAAGLVGKEVEDLAEVLRELRSQGYMVVLVEHNVNLVMAMADHVVVLDQGRVIASATPGEVQTNPEVLRCYLGERANA